MEHLDTSLIKVYDHTIKLCLDLLYDGSLSHPRSVIYTYYDPDKKIIPSSDNAVNVRVVNQDTLDASEGIVKNGNNPLVLNMASDHKPGGGASKGAKAQEEELFRRSDYYRHLHPRHYPLGKTDAIWSPSVTIIKTAEYTKQKFYFNVDFLAVSGLRNPKLLKGEFKPEDEEILRIKIRQIYQIAEERGYKHLVLGALGCGAFNNPPEKVASLFKEELEPYKFSFIEITFAVLCKKDKTNFEVFSKVFSCEY